MNKEEALAVLWEIAHEVAKDDPTYSTGMGDVECLFCSGDDYSGEGFKHDLGCIVTRARALIAWKELST